MSLIVQKYGGSSVADLDKIKSVANRIKSYIDQGHRLVVVVSAMGKTTDRLLEMAREVHPSPPDRELDMLLSTGEQVAIALLSMALNNVGQEAIALTGGQAGIHTSNFHTKAKIITIDPQRILRHLDEKKVVIVAGFQGMNSDYDITTLGRGGSDTTACALAAALSADYCEIFTDVNGVYTADPRIVPHARKINRISYDEMSEMANLGAKVLQIRSVDFSQVYGVKVQVRGSFSQEEGTWVEKMRSMEDVKVRAITHNGNVIKVVFLEVPDRPGIAALIFKELADCSVSVDMIIQSEGREDKKDVAFVVSREDENRLKKVIANLSQKILFKGVKLDEAVAKISIVGAGIASDPNIAYRMFRTLSERKINIDMISTSNLRISCLIPNLSINEAVEALHKEFIEGEEVAIHEEL